MTHKVLPKKIVVLPNNDKKDHEKWYLGRDMLNFPSPFCLYISGPKNSGKTLLIKNLLARKIYDDGYLVHFDGENTGEYDDADINVLENGYIPSNDDIPKEGKKIIIFEDIVYSSLSKEDKIKLLGLVKYTNSHKNCDICITGHDFITSIPQSLRRLFNVFIIYKTPDVASLSGIGSRIGLKNSDFYELFKLCEKLHDNICIDLTKDSPYPLRFNIYHKIKCDDE